MVSPILKVIASSLADLPDSRRKLGLTELIEEAQWRFGLIQAFSRSPRSHILLPAELAPSIMSRMSASPDGLAANSLRINGTAHHSHVTMMRTRNLSEI